MQTKIEKKKSALLKILSSFDTLAVALSGGVDSALLLAEARDILGDRLIAITARGPIHPESDLADAAQLCDDLGVRHLVIDSTVMELPEFLSNSSRRCYICKKAFFKQLMEAAEAVGVMHLVHGANVDDLDDYRPGLDAAREIGLDAPLMDAGFTKSEIREMAGERGLKAWNKPAMACLATRIPYGTPITIKAIEQIRSAEALLSGSGLTGCRVRHHGAVARLELPIDQLSLLTCDPMRRKIVDEMRNLGFAHVCLDLEGYIPGSMNRALKTD